MRKHWYRKILIMLAVFTATVGGSYYFIKEKHAVLEQEVSAEAGNDTMVIPGGMPIGIYLETDGVMVLGTDQIKAEDGMYYAPAENLVKPGDYIMEIDNQKVNTKDELVNIVSRMEEKEVVLTLNRDGNIIDIKLDAVKCEKDDYKLGIWVRDNTQGLGTVTYLSADSGFGALGHGIHDIDTNKLLDIAGGKVYATSIKDIQKGTSGIPGGMQGIIIYNNYNLLGTIEKNTEAGIFGKIERIDMLFADQTPVAIAKKEEIKEGAAIIRCSVDGKVKEYDVEIKRIDYFTTEINKGILIEITDKELLNMTGGIVQGMSGSPIIQDGKLVGAVTHVLVNDPTRGYGIFIENMLEAAG